MDSLERLDVARAALRFEDCDVSFRESNRTAQFELPNNPGLFTRTERRLSNAAMTSRHSVVRIQKCRRRIKTATTTVWPP